MELGSRNKHQPNQERTAVHRDTQGQVACLGRGSTGQVTEPCPPSQGLAHSLPAPKRKRRAETPLRDLEAGKGLSSLGPSALTS